MKSKAGIIGASALAIIAFLLAAFFASELPAYSAAIEGDNAAIERGETNPEFTRPDFWRARRAEVIEHLALSAAVGTVFGTIAIVGWRRRRKAAPTG